MAQVLSRRASAGGSGVQLGGWGRLLLIPVIILEFGLAMAAAIQPRLAFTFILAGVLVIVALVKPVPVLVLAFPAAFAYWRVGPAAIDMSITDAVTVLGAVAALPHVPWRNPRFRTVLLLFSFYLAAVSVSVLASPSVTAIGEVGHRALMVIGPLMIGSALAALGKARLALRAFLLTAAFISAVAIVDTLSTKLAPAYPFGMHKNAVGAHIVSALLVLLAASSVVGFTRWMNAGLSLLLFAGLLATQSRGAALGMVAAAAFFLLRSRNQRLARLAPIVIALTLVLMTFAIASLNSSQDDAVDAKFNSVNTRLEGYDFAIENAWKPHIPFGSGPKWFKAMGFDSGPHNVVVAELSETGVMGLATMVVFLGGVLGILWKRRTALADAGLLVLLERILDSMLGIFWVAGTGTLPWLVVGLAVGEPDDDPPDPAEPPDPLAADAGAPHRRRGGPPSAFDRR